MLWVKCFSTWNIHGQSGFALSLSQHAGGGARVGPRNFSTIPPVEGEADQPSDSVRPVTLTALRTLPLLSWPENSVFVRELGNFCPYDPYGSN